MDKRLYQGGLITIPILKNENFKPSPNYLVIDFQQGKTISQSPNLQTGEMETRDCVFSGFRLVNREILSATSNKSEEFIERTLLPTEQLNIPLELLSCLFTHQRVKQNIEVINAALSLFSFRGELEGLNLQVDEETLDLIIADIETVQELNFE